MLLVMWYRALQWELFFSGNGTRLLAWDDIGGSGVYSIGGVSTGFVFLIWSKFFREHWLDLLRVIAL
eukprot:9403656-Ditylum_brightwellii.AAC.1